MQPEEARKFAQDLKDLSDCCWRYLAALQLFVESEHSWDKHMAAMEVAEALECLHELAEKCGGEYNRNVKDITDNYMEGG